MATVQERLQSIIAKANATTGKTDADMTAATQSLIDGFGSGGSAPNGRSWEYLGDFPGLSTLTFAGGFWFKCVGGVLEYSVDAETWAPCGLTGHTVNSIEFNGGYWFALSSDGLFKAKAPDAWYDASGILKGKEVTFLWSSGDIDFCIAGKSPYYNYKWGAEDDWAQIGASKLNDCKNVYYNPYYAYAYAATNIGVKYCDALDGGTWYDADSLPADATTGLKIAESGVYVFTGGKAYRLDIEQSTFVECGNVTDKTAYTGFDSRGGVSVVASQGGDMFYCKGNGLWMPCTVPYAEPRPPQLPTIAHNGSVFLCKMKTNQIYSTDGVTWKPFTEAIPFAGLMKIICGNGVWVARSTGDPAKVYRSIEWAE